MNKIEKEFFIKGCNSLVNLHGVEIIKELATQDELKVNDLIVFYSSLFAVMATNDKAILSFPLPARFTEEENRKNVFLNLKILTKFYYGSSLEETLKVIEASLGVLEEYDLIFTNFDYGEYKCTIGISDHFDKRLLIDLVIREPKALDSKKEDIQAK